MASPMSARSAAKVSNPHDSGKERVKKVKVLAADA